jgi:hypothetical protein
LELRTRWLQFATLILNGNFLPWTSFIYLFTPIQPSDCIFPYGFPQYEPSHFKFLTFFDSLPFKMTTRQCVKRSRFFRVPLRCRSFSKKRSATPTSLILIKRSGTPPSLFQKWVHSFYPSFWMKKYIFNREFSRYAQIW